MHLSGAWKQNFPNIKNYYIYQVWPAACGDTSANDMLRETQRILPYLYSNMRVMSTLGVVPGSGYHYSIAGYKFMDAVPVGAVSSTPAGVVVSVTENSPDSATDTIVITVPTAKAAGVKLFGLLRGTVP